MRTLGTALLVIALLTCWVVIAVGIADWLPGHWALQVAYFALAGIAWAWPAAWLIRWRAR